ncbi:uncharacterized protein LOC142162253 [Nicotiana tabacum]|uniref:Uncharacterized protein LOC142162253 n=1 Tax=Nicotiana tabacum TaxID=4097 RepID=A0AC58RPN3_TOBAC
MHVETSSIERIRFSVNTVIIRGIQRRIAANFMAIHQTSKEEKRGRVLECMQTVCCQKGNEEGPELSTKLAVAVCLRIVDKFSPRVIPVVFLGYSSSQKGYILYDLNSKSVFVNRNIIFQEDIFPFKHMLSPGSTIFLVLDLLSPISADPKLSATDSSPGVDVPPYEACVTSEGEPSLSPIATSHHTPYYSTSPTNPPSGIPDKVAPVDTHAEAHLDFTEDVDAAEPIEAVNSLSVLPAQVLSAYSACSEPQSFNEAATNPYWVEAIKLEIAALEENKILSIVNMPPRKTPIGCKWIFKIKYKASGKVERYKARLIAKGYNQKTILD